MSDDVMDKIASTECGSAYERSIAAYRKDPAMRTFLKKNYLDEELDEAVTRYSASPEFQCIQGILSPYIKSGTPIADLGSGRGLTSLALAQTGLPVISVEYDASNVAGTGALAAHLKHRRTSLTPTRGDILNLPFRDHTFDVVFCRSVLHHLPDLRRGLAEIHRVLRPGGIFLAVNEHILSAFSDASDFMASHPAVPYGVDERAYPAWKYWWVFRDAGFRKIHVFGGPVLQYGEFLVSVRSHPWRSRCVQLPLIGGAVAKALHAAHQIIRTHLFVDETRLPAISIQGIKR